MPIVASIHSCFSASSMPQASVPGPVPLPMATMVSMPAARARSSTWARSPSNCDISRCACESTNKATSSWLLASSCQLNRLTTNYQLPTTNYQPTDSRLPTTDSLTSASLLPAHPPETPPAPASPVRRRMPPQSCRRISARAAYAAPGWPRSPPCAQSTTPARKPRRFPPPPAAPRSPGPLPGAAACLPLSPSPPPSPGLLAARSWQSPRSRFFPRAQPGSPWLLRRARLRWLPRPMPPVPARVSLLRLVPDALPVFLLVCSRYPRLLSFVVVPWPAFFL